jgi:hypothetical protein
MKKKDSISEKGQTLKEAARSIMIEQPRSSEVALEVTGTADLIQNNFSQKTVEQMLRKHMGINVQKEPKRPRQVLEDAKIKNLDGRICIPPAAFKQAMITAAGTIKGLKKGQLMTDLYVVGSSIPITYKSEEPRMDMVRLAGMTRQPDVRFRPAFIGWQARLIISFGELLSVQSVVDLLNRAGKVGVGEWRPQKKGTFGTFRVSRHISDRAEVEQVYEECAVKLIPLVIPDWAMDLDIDPEVLRRAFDEAAAVDKEEE